MNVEQFERAFDYFLNTDDNKLIIGMNNGTKLIIHAIEGAQSTQDMIVGYNMERCSTSFIPLENIVSLTTEEDFDSYPVIDKTTGGMARNKEEEEDGEGERPIHEDPEDTDSE